MVVLVCGKSHLNINIDLYIYSDFNTIIIAKVFAIGCLGMC